MIKRKLQNYQKNNFKIPLKTLFHRNSIFSKKKLNWTKDDTLNWTESYITAKWVFKKTNFSINFFDNDGKQEDVNLIMIFGMPLVKYKKQNILKEICILWKKSFFMLRNFHSVRRFLRTEYNFKTISFQTKIFLLIC